MALNIILKKDDNATRRDGLLDFLIIQALNCLNIQVNVRREMMVLHQNNSFGEKVNRSKIENRI